MWPLNGPKLWSKKAPKTPQKPLPSNQLAAQTPLSVNTPPVWSPPLPADLPILPPSRPWFPNWLPLSLPSLKPKSEAEVEAEAVTNANKKTVEVAARAARTIAGHGLDSPRVLVHQLLGHPLRVVRRAENYVSQPGAHSLAQHCMLGWITIYVQRSRERAMTLRHAPAGCC